MKKLTAAVTAASLLLGLSGVAAAALTATTNHTYISVANDAGVKFNNWDYSYYGTGGGSYSGAVGPNAYLVKADGSGTSTLAISGATTGASVMNSTAHGSSGSGSFYITEGGGRGFDNDIILGVALTGPVSDTFSMQIVSNGYTWTAAAPDTAPALPTDAVHVTGINETFGKADLAYGPQTLRPGTAASGGSLPVFPNTADQSTPTYLMFVDLYVGSLKNGYLSNLQDQGAAKVDFAFSGLDSATKIAFSAYGWVSTSAQGEGINFTNSMYGANTSGYYVDVTPTPIPPALLLFGSGVCGLFGFRGRIRSKEG